MLGIWEYLEGHRPTNESTHHLQMVDSCIKQKEADAHPAMGHGGITDFLGAISTWILMLHDTAQNQRPRADAIINMARP
jgi:hypothetical protein